MVSESTDLFNVLTERMHLLVVFFFLIETHQHVGQGDFSQAILGRGLVVGGWLWVGNGDVGDSGLSNASVYAFREANGDVSRQDLLAVVNYFQLQIVASGGN